MEYIISDRLQGVKGSIIRELFKLMKDPNIISFGGGNPSAETFPVEDIARITSEAFEKNPIGMLQYGLSEGYDPLRETMKAHLTKNEGFDFTDNELFIVSGGQQAADLTAKVFLNEADVIITEEPSFIGCMNTFRSYNAKLVGVPMRPDGMDIDKLEAALKANPDAKLLYIIPNFQNPTGYTTSAEKRKAIYKLARQYGVMILEDNPYGEIRFAGNPIPAIKTLDTDGRVVYAGSFSKTMAPAFRLGFIVFNRALIPRMTVAKQCTDVHSTVLFQHICHEYMTTRDYKGHIAQTCELYGKKAALMLGEMKKRFHKGVVFNKPEGGLFVMAFLPEGMDSTPFVEEGIRRGVATIPGVAFVVDQSRPNNGFRLNYSTPTDEQIVRGVEILGKLTHEYLG